MNFSLRDTNAPEDSARFSTPTGMIPVYASKCPLKWVKKSLINIVDYGMLNVPRIKSIPYHHGNDFKQ